MWFGLHPISGWIVYFVLVAKPALKVCPACREKLKVNAKNCPYCGHQFDEAGTDHQPHNLKKSRRKNLLSTVGAVAAVVVVFLLFIQVLNGMFTDSDAYKIGLKMTNQNPSAISLIGEDIELAGFITGNETFSGTNGTVSIQIPVKGKTGQGTVELDAVEENGNWKFNVLKLHKDHTTVDILAK